jgi:hypothetical protein
MMRDCLKVLHTDIVTVWNFSDPHRVMALFIIVIAYILTWVSDSTCIALSSGR